MLRRLQAQAVVLLFTLLGLSTVAGCASGPGCANGSCANGGAIPNVPRELTKVTMPLYRIEPPDILEIDVLQLVPKPPYHIHSGDVLVIQATGTLAQEPISGPFAVEPEGTVNLGASYGSVSVVGMTLDDARKAIQAQLRRLLSTNPTVTSVTLAQSSGVEQIRGEHIVIQDGTINLGVYGLVRVVGMTVPEAKAAIEKHLSEKFSNPELSLIVTGYNSKVYYVFFSGAGYGQTYARLPIKGNETVLDAITQLNVMPPSASPCHVRLVRPADPTLGCDQILPVDWEGITKRGEVATNYQILPGDRIYVDADPLINFNNNLQKLIAPIEQMFGVTLLGTETVRTIKFFNAGSGAGGTAAGAGLLGLGF